MKFTLLLLFAVVEAHFILEMDNPSDNHSSLVPKALTDIITCGDGCERTENCVGININLRSERPCDILRKNAEPGMEINPDDAHTMRGQFIDAPACDQATTDAGTTSQTTTPPPAQ